MLFLGGSWDKVGAQGSVDAVWVHRFLPQVVFERIHAVVEGCAAAQGAPNVLLTDLVPFCSALLAIEAQHSHVHGGELKVFTATIAAGGELVCGVIFGIGEKEGSMTEVKGLAQSVMVLGVATGLGIFAWLQEVVEAHGGELADNKPVLL